MGTARVLSASPAVGTGSVDPARAGSRRGPLWQLLLPVDPAPLDTGPGAGQPAWMIADDWRLLARPRPVDTSGEELERFALESGVTVSAWHDSDAGVVRVPFDLDEAYANYVTEAWLSHASPRALSARQLQVYYRIKHLFPRGLLLAARRRFMRQTKLPEFPGWPFDDSVGLLLRFYARCLLAAADATEARFTWFWPRAHRACLMLTHDVESAAGLSLAVRIADLEEERGFRSSFNIVASDYAIDHGIVRELRDRGFEIGLHGLHHDRSLFSGRREFERQLPKLAVAANDLGATGFRSPSTYRVIEWLTELPVAYDCTMFHSDPYEPQPGGCCTLWPFRLGSIVELPYTLPQDHTLFTLLRQTSIDMWLTQVDAIEARYGLIHCLSHPDPGYLGDPDKRALYVELLDALGERPWLWRALPRDVASWWSTREAQPSDPDIGFGLMRRDGSDVSLTAPDSTR